MSRRKVLYVCHNHQSIRPGGSEAYALELYEAMRASSEFEPILVARSGPPVSTVSRPHEGTLFTAVNEDPNQYLVYTDLSNYNWLFSTSPHKEIYTKYFREFLTAYQPDIVHFQHTLFLGYDLILETRKALPNTPIVYTLHEFLPICHRQGQMIRTHNEELCRESSPRRCHECFPDISPQTFFMRKRFIQSHLSMVDLFLAPSRLLAERYVDWGIPREKIRHEENGRRAVNPIEDSENERTRNRIGFFGQFNIYKGVHVLLKAMRILGEDDECDAHLWLHGANLELQPQAFQSEINALLEATRQNVAFVGPYDHTELPSLMADIDWVVVPSIWWENSPLVIQEAFQHRRPVICSDIGGMAEKVTHGVNGLHFRVGNTISLAQTIRRAISSPDLWETLRGGIPEVYSIEDHAEALITMYRALLADTTPRSVAHASR
jgi:glycosyltransferase involved in cell wall biosynthesis